jgi:hypothetical protein
MGVDCGFHGFIIIITGGLNITLDLTLKGKLSKPKEMLLKIQV